MRELTSDRGRAMALYRWACACCGEAHDELPTCWGSPSPFDLLPEGERERRAIFNRDTGILDDNTFFVRGGIYIPIHGMDEPLAWDVWVSLSEESWNAMAETWDDPDRHETTGPFFGWLQSSLPYAEETRGLKTRVHIQPPGQIPWIEVEPTAHPLAVEQEFGVTVERVAEIAARFLAH
ncbi:DUF2199 domain-containing protein [Methylopila sp. Yamaguchi]|uniref:DUF2199 domain-containing protein n=1 Tax=Methylopila sp. Yamaguchi TaxID=1437817 RepID=UPI000CAFAEC8|nr:DUF2199 domain-containing protein [Methylopila sp. Yamaguchi]GBD50758.1 hypothetical protein METY_3971 [Methylopila sp. Yamaguchi]